MTKHIHIHLHRRAVDRKAKDAPSSGPALFHHLMKTYGGQFSRCLQLFGYSIPDPGKLPADWKPHAQFMAELTKAKDSQTTLRLGHSPRVALMRQLRAMQAEYDKMDADSRQGELGRELLNDIKETEAEIKNTKDEKSEAELRADYSKAYARWASAVTGSAESKAAYQEMMVAQTTLADVVLHGLKSKDSYSLAEKEEYRKAEMEHSDLVQKREELGDKGRNLSFAEVDRMKVLEARLKELRAKGLDKKAMDSGIKYKGYEIWPNAHMPGRWDVWDTIGVGSRVKGALPSVQAAKDWIDKKV